MKNEDIVTIREDPELSPEELFRRFVLDKVKSALSLAVKDNEICITANNITFLLTLLNIGTGDELIIDLVREACIETGGVINTDGIGQFVCEKVLPSEEIVEETLKEAFSIVDVDGDDIITGADIYRLMMGIGKIISDEDIVHMLTAVDSDGDGRATYTDFRNFMLGLEPEIPQEPITPEEIQTEEKETDRTDATQPESVPVVSVQQPEHKKRRRLFSYGEMIAKQLSVISNMQRIVDIAKRGQSDDNKQLHVDMDRDGVTEIHRKHTQFTINEGDVAKTSVTDTESHKSLHCVNNKSNTNQENRSENSPNTTETSVSECLTSIGKQMNPESVITCADTGQYNVGCSPLGNKYLANNYNKKSPYYGRIRPEVFSMNPLPPLILDEPIEKETMLQECCIDEEDEAGSQESCVEQDNGGDCRSGSLGDEENTVVMVDRAQQTMGDFDENMAEYGQTTNVCVRSGGADTEMSSVETWPNWNSSIRDSSTITVVHGIPNRVRKVKLLERAILKRSNTSFDLFKFHSEDTEQNRFPAKDLMKKNPLTRQMSFQRPSTGCETSKRIQQISSLSNKLTFSFHEPSDTKFHIPVPPQTPKTDRQLDRLCEKIVSQNVEDNFYVDGINTVELSNVNRDNGNTEIKKPHHNHAFRSMQSLTRAIVALQSTARNTKNVSESLEEISVAKTVSDGPSSNTHSIPVRPQTARMATRDDKPNLKPLTFDYKCETHHHRVRSIRPLAQAVMAFQSTARKTKVISESNEEIFDAGIVSDEPRNKTYSIPVRPQTARLARRDDKLKLQPVTLPPAETVNDEPNSETCSVPVRSQTARMATRDDKPKLQSVTFDYRCETHRHRVRSMRPLARAIMALQSTARNTKIASERIEEVSDTETESDEPNSKTYSIPVRPQTARLARRDNKPKLQPLMFDRKCEMIVSESAEDNSCAKKLNVVEVSDSINRESVYTPEINKSRYHHGFRSIRPLARAIMAFHSTATDTKTSLSAVSSISRVLEETGTPYIKTNSHSERKPTVRATSKSSLLNIELPVEKVFRPNLKRRSTLTRIPVNVEF